MVSKEQVLNILAHIEDPELHRSLTDLNMVREVQVDEGVVTITLALTTPNCPLQEQIEGDVQRVVGGLPGVTQVNVTLTAMTDEERQAILGKPAEGLAAPYNKIDRVVAVMSGKGGVGKSLVTSLLASTLAREGLRVGVLDADITGPSIPKLFGLRGPVNSGPMGLWPLQSKIGIKIMSFNLLLEYEDQPVIWRGPLIGRAITQLWGDVFWDQLDYLLVDLPPGTADAALTTLQSLPVSGIVMVTMPQSLASMIVRKAVHMAQMVNVPIVGVVENMAYFCCPDTGKRHEIFGPSHSQEVSLAASAPLLAQLPIDPSIAALCDDGQIESVQLSEIPALMKTFLEAMPATSKRS